MSYLVLARKWRPGTFAEVVGQEHVTSTLQKAFEKGRLAHAYLFSGPRGCGKTTTARLLAKVINCESPTGGEPCNKCSSCESVNDGTHLDMIEIDGASNRGIDEIRELREKIGYAPSQASSKIYIIDEVHMLTQQAFNALLKTLEEPPGHVYLIFATTEPHKVPATILSRCQRFNFKRLELAELSGQLEKICRAEKVEYDAEAITLVCRRADGSMRDAESLLDQCISAADGRIDLDTVRRVLGLVDSQIVAGLLGAVSRRDREGALAVVDGVAASGMDLEEFFIAFLEGIRNLLVISVSGERTDWLDLTSSEIQELSEIAGRFQVEDLLFIFRSMSRAFRELKASSHPRYHIEAAVAEAASWESAVELGELIQRLEGGGGSEGGGGGGNSRVAGGGAVLGGAGADGKDKAGTSASVGSSRSAGPVQEPETAKTSVDNGERPAAAGGEAEDTGETERSPAIPETPVRDNRNLASLGGREEWERFLSQVREAKLTLGIWLMSAEVAGVENGSLILSFTSQNRFAMEMVRDAGNRRLIENHLEKYYGRKFTVEACENVEVDASCTAAPQAELAMKTRTMPPQGSSPAGEKEPSSGPPAGEKGAAEDIKPGKSAAAMDLHVDAPGTSRKKGSRGGRKSRGKGGRTSKVENPTLKKIIEGLDAELLD